MPKLTFRNSHGDLIRVPTVAAARVKEEFGEILERATRGGAVAITRREKPRAVLLSFDEFQSLVKERSTVPQDLDSMFDLLLARMQTLKAKKGMAAAFGASPARLGLAAMKAAQKVRRVASNGSRRSSRSRAER